MYDKGYVSMATKISEELTLKKARFALEQAQSKKKVLVEYTKAKTIKELQSEVEKARSDELAKKATWELEDSKEKKLEKQIAACKIKAPSDGLVVYANDPNRVLRQQRSPRSRKGRRCASVRRSSACPTSPGCRSTPRSTNRRSTRLARGLKARIRVDAFSDQVLDGTVMDVAPLPDSTNFFSSDIKVYTTKVRIDAAAAGLRPGMTAEVEILVDRKEHVLTVPVLAILQFSGKDHVTKKVDDRFVQTEVELGVSNEKYVEVTKGLSDGDVVVMNPIVAHDRRREASGVRVGRQGIARRIGAQPAARRRRRQRRAAGGPPGAAKKVVGADRRARQGGLVRQGRQGQGQGRRRFAKGKGGRGGRRPRSSRSSRA